MKKLENKEVSRLLNLGFDLWFLRYRASKDKWYQTTDLIRNELIRCGAQVEMHDEEKRLVIRFPWGWKEYK